MCAIYLLMYRYVGTADLQTTAKVLSCGRRGRQLAACVGTIYYIFGTNRFGIVIFAWNMCCVDGHVNCHCSGDYLINTQSIIVLVNCNYVCFNNHIVFGCCLVATSSRSRSDTYIYRCVMCSPTLTTLPRRAYWCEQCHFSYSSLSTIRSIS